MRVIGNRISLFGLSGSFGAIVNRIIITIIIASAPAR